MGVLFAVLDSFPFVGNGRSFKSTAHYFDDFLKMYYKLNKAKKKVTLNESYSEYV